MVSIKLPDGAVRTFDQPPTVTEVAMSIGPGLAKAALAGRVNGRLVDTSHRIESDVELAIVTDKDADGLEVIRHSTAHLLAFAVKSLFPEAQVTIGPVIDNGFYYDFSFKRPFTPEDLAAIEKKMAELAKQDLPVQREVWSRDKAVAFFKSIGEFYKAELIAAIPAGEDVSLYREGEFVDLCRGPHVPSTGRLKVFKLMKVAGAYWRGRFGQRDAAAYLRDGLGQEGGSGVLPPHARGGREARSPAAGYTVGFVSYPRRSARHGVLASARLGSLAADRAVHAPYLSGQRLPGSALSADS